MTTKMNKVFDDIKKMGVLDPCPYALDRRITNSVVDRKYFLIAFFEGSYADKNMDKNYWIKVKHSYLPEKKHGTNIVWYEFQGKHIQIVN